MPDEQPLKRWFPRRKVSLPCWVSWQDRQVPARAVDVSYAGVGILLSEAVGVNVDVLIQVPEGISTFTRSEEHTSELQSQSNLVCRLLLEKKKKIIRKQINRVT